MLSSVSGSAANASRMRPRSTGSPLTISPPRNPSHEEVGGGIDGFDRNRGLDRQIHQGEALGLRATETDQIEILGCPRRGEPRRGGASTDQQPLAVERSTASWSSAWMRDRSKRSGADRR
jgi:hypothetical protein